MLIHKSSIITKASFIEKFNKMTNMNSKIAALGKQFENIKLRAAKGELTFIKLEIEFFIFVSQDKFSEILSLKIHKKSFAGF